MATVAGDKSKFGSYSAASVEVARKPLVIVNAYTQYNWRGAGTLADYEAIRRVFGQIKRAYAGKRIGYPAIGAGLVKGDWAVISAIIDEELAGEDQIFVKWEK